MPAEIPQHRADWPDRPFRAGQWRVEPRNLSLVGEHRESRLEPRVMRLLIALSEVPGEVITRRELLERIWPDVIVNEDALTRAVSDLRRQLGETSDGEPAVATIRGVGYRLDLPVEPIGRTAPSMPHRPLAWKWMAMATAGLAVLWVAGSLLTLLTKTPEPVFIHLRALTAEPGFETDPALSNDGRLVAYTRADDFWAENYNLYLRAVAGGDTAQLTDLPGRVGSPAFSPDASEIAFAYTEGSAHSIRSVSSSGGAPQLLARTRSWVLGLDWSPDGRRLVFAERGPDDHRFHLVGMRRDGSDRGRLTTPPAGSMGDQLPAFSPDGRRIAFMRSDATGYRTLWMLPANGGEPEALIAQAQSISGFDWSDDNHITYAVDLPGDSRLYRIALDTRASTRLPADNRRINRLARAAGVLVLAEPSTEDGVFRLDAEGRMQELSPSTQWDGAASVAAASADVAFLSARGGRIEPWILPTGRSDPAPIAGSRDDGQPSGRPVWQSDGRRLAMVFRDDQGYRIDLHDRDNGQSREFFRDPRALRLSAWSQDGRWLYFSRDVDGQWSIWRIGTVVPGAPPQQVTGPGAFSARESPVARSLVYLDVDRGGLWLIPLTDDLVGDGEQPAARKLADLPVWEGDFWGLTSTGFYRMAGGDGGFGLRLGAFDSDATSAQLLVAPNRQLMTSASISSDGTVVVFSMETPTGSDLKIAELPPDQGL